MPSDARFWPSQDEEPRLHRWRQWTDWPLTALAALFLCCYAVQVLYVNAALALTVVVDVLIWVTWSVFALDYVIRFCLARRKLRFVARNPFDLAVVLLPMLRQLRALRVLTVVTLLNRRLIHSFQQRVALYASGATLLVGLCASLACQWPSSTRSVARRTRPSRTSLRRRGGRSRPSRRSGTTTAIRSRARERLVAATLMVGGIALLGVVIGLVVSWLVRTLSGAEEAAEARTAATVSELRAELAELRLQLSERQESTHPEADTATRT